MEPQGPGQGPASLDHPNAASLVPKTEYYSPPARRMFALLRHAAVVSTRAHVPNGSAIFVFSISWSNKSKHFLLRNLDQFTVMQPPQGAVRAKQEQKVVAEAPQSHHNAIGWERAACSQQRRQQGLGCAWWDCMAPCVWAVARSCRGRTTPRGG